MAGSAQQVLDGLAERVREARVRKRALRIRGGDTRAFYGHPWPDGLEVLDMSAYRGIVSYEPSELVVVARAGTPLAEVESVLAEHQQMLAFEPPRFGRAGTLGGCIASGLAGPRRMAAGRAADFVLGTRLINSQGSVLHFGGEVMKNVAGYDLSRLLTGSLGILGPMVEVSLKVMPRPRCEATVALELNAAEALQQCDQWRSLPAPVSATAWLAGDVAPGLLHVRLSGSAAIVRQWLAKIGGERVPDAVAETFWTGVRDQTHDFFRQRPLWRVLLPPCAPVLDAGPTLYEWSGSRRWLAGLQDADRLRSRVASLGGSVCLYRRGEVGSDVPAFHSLETAIARIHQRLKQEFDPEGIFNPGRLLPGL